MTWRRRTIVWIVATVHCFKEQVCGCQRGVKNGTQSNQINTDQLTLWLQYIELTSQWWNYLHLRGFASCRKHIIYKVRWGKYIIPDLVSLHDALFVALQTGSQTLLIQPHPLFILKIKAIYTLLANINCAFINVQFSVIYTHCALVSGILCNCLDFCDLI